MTYEDIPGWFDFGSIYFEQIQRAKDGARFVEVGSWLGRSTAYMATKIKESGKKINFDAVDPWIGMTEGSENEMTRVRTAEVGGNLGVRFLANMEACGVSEYVTPITMESLKASELYEDESLDFVFIDGDHRAESVYADLKAWWPKIKPGGLLAGHDYNNNGPRQGVERFAAEGHAVYGDGANTQHGYACFGIPKPVSERIHVFMALPTYGGQSCTSGTIVASTCAYSGIGQITYQEQSISLLASNFNALWCQALNNPDITHFAMLHADIVPMRWWIDVLIHELVNTQSHMVSTVVPIKDGCGVTSTGIASNETNWHPFRRFTMPEVLTMPSTFDSSLAKYPNNKIIVNTGCWLADIRDPRWRETDENGFLKCFFTINDAIANVGGKWVNFCEPEDFFFSKRVQSVGMKVVATRKVQVNHKGGADYKNDSPWGNWRNGDEATRGFWDTPVEA